MNRRIRLGVLCIAFLVLATWGGIGAMGGAAMALDHPTSATAPPEPLGQEIVFEIRTLRATPGTRVRVSTTPKGPRLTPASFEAFGGLLPNPGPSVTPPVETPATIRWTFQPVTFQPGRPPAAEMLVYYVISPTELPTITSIPNMLSPHTQFLDGDLVWVQPIVLVFAFADGEAGRVYSADMPNVYAAPEYQALGESGFGGKHVVVNGSDGHVPDCPDGE